MGGIDDDWLEYIMNDKDGEEIAVLNDSEQLVAVVGITYPAENYSFYVITNLAIHPESLRTGLGSKVLNQLLLEIPLKPGQYWVTYVEAFNLAAQQFFLKNGWEKVLYPKDEMILFRKTGPNFFR